MPPTESIALPATDRRNPVYYLSRAGYELPASIEWYWDGKKKGEREPPVYSKEGFVTGIDSTCREFYLIRRAMATEILQKNMEKLNLATEDAEWDVETVVE
jgi:hypothetical protein